MGWKDKVASKVWGAIKPTIKPRTKPDKSKLDLLKSEAKILTAKAKGATKLAADVKAHPNVFKEGKGFKEGRGKFGFNRPSGKK
mgnify:FL=1